MKRIHPLAWAAAGAIVIAVPTSVMIVRKRKGKPEALVFGGRGASTRVRKRWFFDAPRDRVFAYWTAFASFPDFLDGVSDVRELARNRHRFTLRGPDGTPLVWEAVIKRLAPGTALEWDSAPGSPVQCRGVARFLSEARGGTVVELDAEYGSSSEWMVKGMERFLSRDLPGYLQRDVLRMKALIETGSAEL